MTWPEARAAMIATGITKYCDYNLLNIASDSQAKHTFELRVLPTSLAVEPVLLATALFEGILRRSAAAGAADAPMPSTLSALIDGLGLDDDVRAYWKSRALIMRS